jgi:prepilin-type N-terminal cleavage/methylation domain-containing protein
MRRHQHAFTFAERPALSNRPAFTLVELLVVIGIIAVLISVLLPSLNKARQAASLIDCQARLAQMGQAVQMYVANNNGLLPWGAIDHGGNWTDNVLPNSGMQERIWWWYFTLSEIMNRNLLGSDALVSNLSPIFRDRDTIENPQTPRWVSHYTANPRVLYQSERDDAPDIFNGWPSPSQAIQPKDRVTRKMSNVKHPSNVFLIWDGPQVQDQNYNAYGLAASMDAWGLYATSGFCYGTPSPGFNYDRAILPGQLGVTGRQDGKAFQKSYNIDYKEAFGGQGWLSHLRFRHLNNTRLAALCVDGHVETRAVGTVMIRDIFTNYK